MISKPKSALKAIPLLVKILLFEDSSRNKTLVEMSDGTKSIVQSVLRHMLPDNIDSWNNLVFLPEQKIVETQRIATAVERMANRIAPVSSISEELAKLKELLDKGIITKEEYEKAKKKLLGE